MENLVMDSELSVFKGKRVFVTGHTGFKGSWLSLWLHKLGADVMGYALPPEREHDHFNLLGLNKLIRHVEGDIRDLVSLSRAVDEFQPEIMFHLAAQALVRVSYAEPKDTFDTNVAGSVNVLEVCRNSSTLKTLIFVTSDKCYRNKEWIWGYRENDELGGHDPYSASKAAAELVFSSYVDSFFSKRTGFGAASVRAGNVIGGGDWSLDRLVPDCMKALADRRPIVLRNPVSTRPWQHVLEPLHGYLTLASRLYEAPDEFAGSWNFGPRVESVRTVRDLAENIITNWGAGELQIQILENAPHEAGLLQLNCDKAHQLLGWQPCWNFQRSVAETVRWYKEIAAGAQAVEISTGQIRNYMEARV